MSNHGTAYWEARSYYEETTGRSWSSRPTRAERRAMRRERVRREYEEMMREVKESTDE